GAVGFRKRLTSDAVHHDFQIGEEKSDAPIGDSAHDCIVWKFRDMTLRLLLDKNEHPLIKHTLVKMLLNIHSTLIMGRLGRYEGNLMTWVYPNNGKLIDRAARYVGILLERRGVTVSYDEVVRRLLDINRDLPSNTSVVLKTVEAFKGTR